MEETLGQMTRGPNPDGVASLLTEEEANKAKEAVRGLRENDHDRFAAARSAFEAEDNDT